MKTIIALTLCIVGINTFPQFSTEIDLKNERLVTDSIASAIQELSQNIKDAGLDPFFVRSNSVTYALPVPVLFDAKAMVEEFMVTGLSEIIINRLSFNVITLRLNLDISLPLIEASLRNADSDVTLFGQQYTASVSGRLAIFDLRLVGDIRVRAGLISGISIRSINLNFNIRDIQSALNVEVFNRDLSWSINNFLGNTIPSTLNEFRNEINELLEIIALQVAEEIL